jgi:hypothetical protein
VVISIIAVLISILLPALRMAKETAAVTQCLSNLGQLAATAQMYMDDSNVGAYGSFPTLPWHLGRDYAGISYGWISEWSYGGFQPSIDHPAYSGTADWKDIPTELRPFNKYIAPGVTGRVVVKSYICPSDKSYLTSQYGQSGIEPERETRYAAHEVQGTSYPILWHWYEHPMFNHVPDSDKLDIEIMSFYGSQVLSQKIGGYASEFPIFIEDDMDAYMSDARPPDGSDGSSPLIKWGVGWHGKVSKYCLGFLDGHADYMFIDTRYSRGPGYNIWPGP